MHKNIAIIILFFSGSIYCMPQVFINKTYTNGFESISFEADKLHYKPFYDGPREEAPVIEYNFTINNESNISYINITNNTLEDSNKLLILSHRNIIFIYTHDNSQPWFIGFSEACPRMIEALAFEPTFFGFPSSELTEGNRVYDISNLANISLFNPWVEGTSSNGIGEYFTILLKPISGNRSKATALLFSNGFVSYDKDYLFERNSRVKQLSIFGIESGYNKIIDLPDTSDIQYISLDGFENEDLRVEITEIYQGTHYNDTCINFIIPYFGLSF